MLEHIHEAETNHDCLVLDIGADDPSVWTRTALTVADRVVVIMSANPASDEVRRAEQVLAACPLRSQVERWLVLLQPPAVDRPRGSGPLADRLGFDRLAHVSLGSAGDVGRLARIVSGNGTGLVLSGGGARGFAHLGVWRVLNELGIEIDVIGGASIGAPLGAGMARRIPPDDFVPLATEMFHDLLDYTVPVVSLVKGARRPRPVAAVLLRLDQPHPLARRGAHPRRPRHGSPGQRRDPWDPAAEVVDHRIEEAPAAALNPRAKRRPSSSSSSPATRRGQHLVDLAVQPANLGFELVEKALGHRSPAGAATWVMDNASPSEQGVSPLGISAFLDTLERDPRIEPHGLIIQRHGRRIVEGYWAPHTGDRRRLVYSLSKSFTGTALGLQLGEGRLSLDDLVSDHLPELFDGADAPTRRMRVRHIASMATGHDRETFLEALAIDPADPVRGFFKIPPDAEPGTFFAYNQPPVLALATILQRLAGERLTEYLRPRVLDPIGISSFRWAQFRPGLDMGFSGVHTNLDAVARLGQLYLDDGVWNGRRILPEGWVANASATHIANPQREEPDWRQGYGFQLWRSRHGYRGDGAFGQYMVVLPEYDAVVAMFSCTEPMQAVLDAMWDLLLPAMSADPTSPTSDDAALARRLDTLSLPTVAERRASGRPAPLAMTFDPAPPEPASQRTVSQIESSDGRIVIHDGDDAIEVPLTIEWTVVDAWHAASATQLADGRLAVDVVFLATPHRLEIELDPSTQTFSARWPNVPLFGAGIQKGLTSMRDPDE